MSTTMTVPSSAGNGTGVSFSAYGDVRTLVRAGGANDDVIEIQGSMDDSGYVPLRRMQGSDWILTITDRCEYYRPTLIEGTGGGSIKGSGGPSSVTADSGPLVFGNTEVSGTASTTDATATQVASFTATQNGAYSVFGHLIGCKDDETVYSAVLLCTYKQAAGTFSAIEVVKVAESVTSLNCGDATATASGSTGKINAVGVAATNIHWTFKGALLIEPAF
jgi:hypothetical protein